MADDAATIAQSPEHPWKTALTVSAAYTRTDDDRVRRVECNPGPSRSFQNSNWPLTLNRRPCSTPVGLRNWLLALVEKVVLICVMKSLLIALQFHHKAAEGRLVKRDLS